MVTRAPDSCSCATSCVRSMAFAVKRTSALSARFASLLASRIAPAAPVEYASDAETIATAVSTSAVATGSSDGGTRRKYGYARPSLNPGLSEDGDIIGICLIAATRAADTEAPEQPAPMIASTP
eukprot:153129-Prymnesium_polylepis.1